MDELMKRTHYCGTLRKEDIGKKAVVNGWVAKNRRLGALVFADIRDRSGNVVMHGFLDSMKQVNALCDGISQSVREFLIKED